MKTSVTKTAGSTSSGKRTRPAPAAGTKDAASLAKPNIRRTQSTAKTRAETQVQSAPRSDAGGTKVRASKPASSPTSATNAGVRAGARSSTKASAPTKTGNKPAGPADTTEQPAVSKASEVATKTTKPTSAAPQDGALLTEEQILQMSEKDYMNEAQLAFFRARLQQLERDLLKNAGETTEHLRETVVVPDPADRATIEEEHALELRTRDRERKLLKKVQQALASIETGDYGWCEETGEPIGIPRLLARPTATLSLEAQQRRELKQKLYGD